MTKHISIMRQLSPVRNSTTLNEAPELAREQLQHFGIDPESVYGQALLQVTTHLYQTGNELHQIATLNNQLKSLPKTDKISYFNAKKFLCFQLAKLIDMLQPSLRNSYEALDMDVSSRAVKGDYPLFANVGALFSATPAIVRTATYIYACTEWVEDAFHGKENTHPVYSRLLNPTSISLSNTIVSLEAGRYAADYMAWNFNSGMAAIDSLLSNQLRHGDILLTSRNVYGGSFQLINDFYACPDRLDIQLEWFDGYTGEEFDTRLKAVHKDHQQRLKDGRRLFVYLESPCNPHGYVMDVPEICRSAHQHGHLVMLDSTLATPFLSRPLHHPDKNCRPDWVIHSYTKDLSGGGSTTAGGIIGESFRMFLPKGSKHTSQNEEVNWDQTLFWDVYYIKGAFLDADKAIEVIQGIKTLENRMLTKCINTLIFTHCLNHHPLINVNSHGLKDHPNHGLCQKLLYLGLPSPLFTIDIQDSNVPRDAFVRFFDALEPVFGHMVSLGQSNTLILCPALTSHSEMDQQAQAEADIHLTTIRIAMGDENPRDLINQLTAAAKLHIDPVVKGFSDAFMTANEVEKLIKTIHLDVHERHLNANYQKQESS